MAQIETVLAVTDWLNGVGGAAGKAVNNFLPNVPTVAGDAAPTLVQFIADPFRDERVADMKEPPKYPALYVTPDGPMDLEGAVGAGVMRMLDCAVAIRVLTRGSGGKERRDAHYISRAIEQSLLAFLEDSPAGMAARTVNNIYIESAAKMRAGPWSEAIGAARVVAVFGIAFRVRDTQPFGIATP